MKTVKSALALLLFFSTMGISANTMMGKIVICRSNEMNGSHLGYKIFINDSLVTILGNNSCYTSTCKAGAVTLKVNDDEKSKLNFSLKEGEVKNINVSTLQTGASLGYQLSLLDSTSASSKTLKRKLWEDRHIVKAVFPKHRLELDYNFGLGLKREDLISIGNNKYSSFSYGGTIGVSAGYAFLFEKHFEFVTSADFHFSELMPSINNGSVTFTRFKLSLTPLLVFPLRDESKRIKIGFGPEFYFAPNVSVRTSKIKDGFNDNWKYKDARGYHICALFESFNRDKWSYKFGLNYYHVIYEIESANKIYYDPFFLKPDGSGVELVIGLGYHF